MSVVISDEVLQTVQMSEAELLQEIAVMLFQQERFTLLAGKSLRPYESTSVSTLTCQSQNFSSLRHSLPELNLTAEEIFQAAFA